MLCNTNSIYITIKKIIIGYKKLPYYKSFRTELNVRVNFAKYNQKGSQIKSPVTLPTNYHKEADKRISSGFKNTLRMIRSCGTLVFLKTVAVTKQPGNRTVQCIFTTDFVCRHVSAI